MASFKVRFFDSFTALSIDVFQLEPWVEVPLTPHFDSVQRGYQEQS